MVNKIIIISRHPGAIAWIKSRGYDGEVISHLEEDNIVKGGVYIGNLPLPMIEKIKSNGAEFVLLSLPKVAFSDRGHDLSPEEMENAGATLHMVMNIHLIEITKM